MVAEPKPTSFYQTTQIQVEDHAKPPERVVSVKTGHKMEEIDEEDTSEYDSEGDYDEEVK